MVDTPPTPIRITVIHGDPSKPNIILPGGKWDEDDFDALFRTKAALSSLKNYKVSYLCDHDKLWEECKKLVGNTDLILQFCDEGYMNNPRMELHVIAILEMLGLPFSGTGPVLGTFLDKLIILKVCESIGIPTPKTYYIDNDSDLKDIKFDYPVFVKPNSTDGSFGITRKSVAHNADQLGEALNVIRKEFNITCPILVQEYLEGADINCCLIGNPLDGFIDLPLTEEDYSCLPPEYPKILNFESKWDPSSPYWNIKSVLTTLAPEKQKFILECSKKAFHRLELRDYARFDWRLDANGSPKLLEINPNCGWCFDGHLNKTAMLTGFTYADTLRSIIETALKREKRNTENLKNSRAFYIQLPNPNTYAEEPIK